ncbi:aerolysin-like protein [Salminus brasiliensis]|uniref:aerolysin-like protein n=1 Tax=Salminus brasiliensis TaxID=930266 RepID=UPI003B839B6C
MSYLAPICVIGGHGENSFNFSGADSGASLEKIEVCAEEWQIKFIKIWLTNGKSMQFGRCNPILFRDPYSYSGICSEYKFQPGERITSLSLWDNGDGTRLGAIKFTTTSNGCFFPKMTSMFLKTEHTIDVGSGICVGVLGRAGSDIDSLGFMFINTIKSAVLTNVIYPTLHNAVPQVDCETLKSMEFENRTSIFQQYKIESTRKIVYTSSWSVSNKMESTFSMTVKAGVPEVADIKGVSRFIVGFETFYSLNHSVEKGEVFTFPVQVPPNRTVDAKITIGRAVVDLPYTGTVKITCFNGSVLEINISGTYRGVTYTNVGVHVMEGETISEASDVLDIRESQEC